MSDLVHHLWKIFVSRLWNSKYLIVVHVVDVSPHCVNGKVILNIVFNHIPPFIFSNPAKSALLPSKWPHRWHTRHTSQLYVLCDQVIWFATLEEILLNGTTNGYCSNNCISSYCLWSSYYVVSSIRIIVKNSDPILCVTLVLVEGLESIHVTSCRIAIINGVCCIMSPSRMNTSIFVLIQQISSSFSHSQKWVII